LTSRNANLSAPDLTRLFNTAHISPDDGEIYDSQGFVAELRHLEIKLYIAQDDTDRRTAMDHRRTISEH
jgi:hypothetical protein